MSELYETCDDDRFELIGKAKSKLLEATNIEMRHDEMAVIDSILFRCWQMGWLDQLCENRYSELFGTPERAARTVFGIVYSETHGCDDDCPLTEFCNAHVDEEPPDDEGESALLEWLKGEDS